MAPISNTAGRKRFKTRPTTIDLFSGCGGLTLGVKRAGFRVLAAVDNDPLSVETYKANHPEVKVWSMDVRDLKTVTVKRQLKIKKGQLDLLAGCPPCQGFSVMRTLNGGRRVRDSRNDLLFEFIRFVRELRPKAVMLENVPGLVRDKRFRVFRHSLSEMGYKGGWRILNAADYGVPQRRRRLIYMAGLGRPIPFAAARRKLRTVRQTIGSLPRPGNCGDPLHDLPERRTKEVIDLIKRIPKNGGGRMDLPAKNQLDCHRSCDGFKDVYGRMAWDDVAPTITSGCFNPSKGRFIHPVQNRAVTMREAALLQGFPRRYHFPNLTSKVSIALLVGNAIPPALVASQAKMIDLRINSA